MASTAKLDGETIGNRMRKCNMLFAIFTTNSTVLLYCCNNATNCIRQIEFF